MAMSAAAITYVHRLTAALSAMALTTSFAAAEDPMKGADYIRVVADQMHQLQVVKVEAYRVPRAEIGDRPDRVQ